MDYPIAGVNWQTVGALPELPWRALPHEKVEWNSTPPELDARMRPATERDAGPRLFCRAQPRKQFTGLLLEPIRK
jgi:hypothetical protein